MPRDIPVGNRNFLIAFDRDYQIRDIYYPFVGKENHTEGHPFRFGIWAEGTLVWMSREWDLDRAYAPESLATVVSARHKALEIDLDCTDRVDYVENIYIRKIAVHNRAFRAREIRLFLHHDFHLMESPVGDTAYYDPDEKAIIHYKDTRYFLVGGLCNQAGFSQYATGVKEFRTLEGTWRDAEDGVLEASPIAQGSVDSTICFSLDLGPGDTGTVYYWIAAGKDYSEVSRLNRMVLGHGPEHFIARTDNYWRAWLTKEDFDLTVLPAHLVRLFTISLLLINTNIDAGGAILAANDSDIQHFAKDTYSYMWPRDGSLTACALDGAGYFGVTRHFFDFCRSIIERGKESVGYFLHKYNPDASLASSWHPWVSAQGKQLPIQEDGTALVVWALWLHYDRFRDIEFTARQYEALIIRCADFLASYRDDSTGLPLPCYDLWEEEWGVHTFTVSAVFGGLQAAARFAGLFGDLKRQRIYTDAARDVRQAMEVHLYSPEQRRFLKGIRPREDGTAEEDLRVDASTYGVFYFGAFTADDPKVVSTMEAVKAKLWVKTAVGGVARYEGDRYHQAGVRGIPGNPWIICTLWLAQWHIARARTVEELRDALPFLEWAYAHALPSGVLAEQVHPETGQPVSVSPLTWSHAAYVSTVLEYLEKLEQLDICPSCGQSLYSARRQGKTPLPPAVKP